MNTESKLLTNKAKKPKRQRRRYYPCDVLDPPERCGACYNCMLAGKLTELLDKD